MKAIVYQQYGSTDQLQLRGVPTPTIGDEHVLVRVHACGLNDWDLALLKGDYANRFINGWFKPKKTQILGCDIAGVVEQVGAKVKNFNVGDRVYGDLSNDGFGGLAEFVCASETAIYPMVDNMSFEQAAAIPQSGVLATQALLDSGQVKDGQTILINGAGGGVGPLGVQVLKAKGRFEVTGVDSECKLSAMQAIGFDHVINYETTDFTSQPKLYDLIVDTKTNRPPQYYLRVLKPMGRYVTVGGANFRIIQLALYSLFINRFSRKHASVVMLKPNKDLAIFNELFQQQKLNILIDKTFSLAETPAAFQRYLQGVQVGKVVISIP